MTFWFFSDLNLPASHGESDPPYSNESETNDLAPHAAESEFHTSNSEFESENEDLAPTNLEGSSNQGTCFWLKSHS